MSSSWLAAQGRLPLAFMGLGLLWLVAAISFVVAVVDGFRGRRRAQVHPERFRGVWLGTLSLVLAIAALVGITASVLAVVGDDPAADAPASLGDLKSVQVARWGYQRVQRYSDNGWKQPAREAGSCWAVDDDRTLIESVWSAGRAGARTSRSW